MRIYYRKKREEIRKYQKEYSKVNKEKLAIKTKEWQSRNRDLVNERQRKRRIRTNYSDEKTPYQRKIRNIKRRTRYKYPLGKEKCKYCDEIATEHHHTTNPITIDNFEYVCHKHHIQAERHQKEVKHNGNNN